MPNYRPYLTNDGSIGLFSGDFDDIFHSKFGALSEAYEKFVIPANINKLFLNDNINVLDICYGIGYNSKALLNSFLKNYLLKNFSEYFENNIFNKSQYIVPIGADKKPNQESNNIETIGVDNNVAKKSIYHLAKIINSLNRNFIQSKNLLKCIYNDSDIDNNIKTVENRIFSDFPQINIEAIELEKEFVFLSPFIKNNCYKSEYKIYPIVSELILDKLLTQYKSEFINEISNYDVINQNKRYFDRNLLLNCKKYNNKGYKYLSENILSTLLHNIYYRHISKQVYCKNEFLNDIFYQYITKRYLRGFYNFLFDKININYFINDARDVIKNISKKYDLIFLDAFTPSKAPMLWTVQFFEKLSNLLSDGGYILTYSKSARVYSAVLKNNLYLGHVMDSDNKVIGTIISKNRSNLANPFTEEELSAINTRSGIPYNDYSFSDNSDTIIKNLEHDVLNSDLPTFSKFMKGHQDEI